MDKGHFIMREKNICLWLGNEEIPFLECERILWYDHRVDEIARCDLMKMPLDTEEQIKEWEKTLLNTMAEKSADSIAGIFPMLVIPFILKLGLEYPVFGITPSEKGKPWRILNFGKEYQISRDWAVYTIHSVQERDWNSLLTEDSRGLVFMEYGWSSDGIKVLIEAVTADGVTSTVEVTFSSLSDGVIGRFVPEDLKYSIPETIHWRWYMQLKKYGEDLKSRNPCFTKEEEK